MGLICEICGLKRVPHFKEEIDGGHGEVIVERVSGVIRGHVVLKALSVLDLLLIKADHSGKRKVMDEALSQ